MGERRFTGDIFGSLFFKCHEWKGFGRAEAVIQHGEIVTLGRLDIPERAMIFEVHISTGQADILELGIVELHKLASLLDDIGVKEHLLNAGHHKLPQRMKVGMV